MCTVRAQPHRPAIISPIMAAIPFTSRQREAIGTVGRSVIVSAAAGSGKTAVLAERCAYLVCDAPPAARCDVDELLVLTFTEAAAAEMRARIVESVRARSQARPHDTRLREQAALVDAARISTIHSFCLWLVRRWFSHAGVDPTATVLDADEARLLKGEVLDALFSKLYSAVNVGDEPLGRADSDAEFVQQIDDTPAAGAAGPERGPPIDVGRHGNGGHAVSGQALARLVEAYGLGEDRDIARFVLRLSDFTASLPDPEAWLREAHESLADRPERTLLARVGELSIEIDRQIEHGDLAAAALEVGHPVGHSYASQIRDYVEELRIWQGTLQASDHGAATAGGRDGKRRSDPADPLASLERVRRRIAEYEFSRRRAPSLSKEVDPGIRAARDSARALLRDVKERLFRERLQKRFALFSGEEWILGMSKTAPHVRTIVDLVLAFHEAYARKKRDLSVLDFSDLERFAFRLLRAEGKPDRPSAVAGALHRQFAHVLVDEFQDINPIQQAVIRLASRESDPDRANNLFVVGDVKQSIYRFRLAEPALFADRLGRCADHTVDDAAVSLQHNFRSRAEILEAINVCFRRLMREGGGEVVYDADAELRAGREFDAAAPARPVVVHLLERSWDGTDYEGDEPERGVAVGSDPDRWSVIEREAHLIGMQIRGWMASGQASLEGRPLRYRDIVILLRAARVNAERMAGMLSSMGIPAYADVGGSLFGTRETRDIVAALQVLDNTQQDLPLAGALRGGVMSEPFSANDLAEIRCLDRDIPFHAAAGRYVEHGENPEVRERLRSFFARIERFRAAVRRRPLADVLWHLYQVQGYLAYAGGLPNGEQRRANLLKLHELARRFGSFRRQGLYRFLQFVNWLEEQQEDIATAPSIGETEDVVRLMSIHQAKGLEFPVVIVAGLGTRFNLGDRGGRMIFDRTAKIGLRVVDPERMIEYPSAAHVRVASQIERTTREEELRILYVAMTRAREKLVLVGSVRDIRRYREGDGGSPRAGAPACGHVAAPALLSSLSVATAMTPLDWLIPVLSSASGGVVRGLGGVACDRPLFDVHLHDVAEMAAWRVTDHADDEECAVRREVARLRVLPAGEPLAPDDPVVNEVLTRLETTYPTLASASARASIAAGEFKGSYDFTHDPEHRRGEGGEDDFRMPPAGEAATGPGGAAYRGRITHRVLQHLDFAAAADEAGVASELQRMVSEGLIGQEDLAAVDRSSIAWFASTPLARGIRNAAKTYWRECPYIAAEALTFFDRSIDAPPDDYVLVRGIVDGILPVADGIDIVDFKTDVVAPEAVAERARRYRPQMELYARAVSRLWRRPVRTCHLVFLGPRMCHAMEGLGSSPA